jgi:hypothetical protein
MGGKMHQHVVHETETVLRNVVDAISVERNFILES